MADTILWSDNFAVSPYARPEYAIDAPLGAFGAAPGGLRCRIKSDQPPDASGHRRRCEIRLRDPVNPKHFLIDPASSFRRYELSLRVPRDWKIDPQKFVLWQAHQAYGSGSTAWVNALGPPLSLHIWNKKLELVRRYSTAEGAGVHTTTIKVWKDAEFLAWLGVTRTLSVTVRWFNTSAGRLTLILDGKLLHAEYGPQGYGNGCYSTIAGIYAPGWATEQDPAPGQSHDIYYESSKIIQP